MSRRSRPHYRPGRSGLHRDYLSFGAAVRLGLLPHTASRRQGRRLTTATTACSCLWLAVATISPREGLSPPIQCPCQAHTVGLRPSFVIPTAAYSHPDCRAILIMIVAPHRSTREGAD